MCIGGCLLRQPQEVTTAMEFCEEGTSNMACAHLHWLPVLVPPFGERRPRNVLGSGEMALKIQSCLHKLDPTERRVVNLMVSAA